ncbi:nuclear pore complex protein Nup98-Nup96 isoform X1 [Vespa velutina]|uniref:nuclear pore complex protein Nup98-Nup96 isoform X1 n=1 Tax=Vespa velutina TaxID=202808 RepID=UPI001FB4F217|nr:nuclear pore complex protein Nup98-Nup96 isoform X1 [Vespa velutina]XP_047352982.1 nuclear pore complex protein Nup98-Nup96 isoform X1 [Vespa velutina]XP_047352983.1 nuclear pore complex protein Nup98-Nup96 isoform X1 [Vespa velutina]
MFGQSGNTSFTGFNTATQSSPFGQSAFSKPITTSSFGMGTSQVFGSGNTSLFSSKPAGSSTSGLFGNTTTPPAFRQQTNAQPSFGGFGTTNTNTNLFGTQQNATPSLFGASTATSAFGQGNKTGGFSFNNPVSSNLFGQPQQPSQQVTPFGQTNATGNTNLFGTTGGFSNTPANTAMTGTVVKFTPVITTDSMTKNGTAHSISGRHCCIVAMKEYESKSYEELRFEDYSVGRKGPQGPQGPSTGLFGSTAQPSPFGNTAAGTSTAATGFSGMSGGFGSTSQSGSSSLFGKPMTNFGGQPATTANTFAFNSTTNTNLFGNNTQAKPFGTAAPTSLFQTSNANQTAGTGFGNINTTPNTGFGPAFGNPQPNQTIGLFSQNKSAFNIPSTSSGTGFTNFGQTSVSNSGTSLFNAKPAMSGFGTPSFGPTSAPLSFGSNTGFNTGQNSGNSLFNSSFKPAGQTPGFSFGSTGAPSTGLGTNTGLNLGGSSTLFGQQKPSGVFGNTGNTTTFNNPGSFGGSFSFGANNNTMSGQGTGLLSGLAPNQVKNSGTVPVHQQILALVSAPFGDSPLLKNLLPASGKTEELLKPTNAASKILSNPQYKVATNNKSPKIKTKIVSTTQLSKKSLFEGLEEEDPVLSEAFQPRPSAKRLVLRPKPITNSTTQSLNENSESHTKNDSTEERIDNSNVHNSSIEAIDKENKNLETNRQFSADRKSSTSWLKSSLPRKERILCDDELFEGQQSPFSETNNSQEIINNTITELNPHNSINNQTDTDLSNLTETPLSASLGDKSSIDLITQNTDTSQELDANSMSTSQNNWSTNLAKVTLQRVGYYTIPPLDKLDNYVCGETCVVPHFTVGRRGYGNVLFPESFDIYGLNLDEIVYFRHKEVIIYPDDEKKPPVGQGLNRKAQVTLERVWPHDKTRHEPITDPHRIEAMNYEAKLRKVSAKHDTNFLEYRPETGSWVFKVDHFSKYGLSDSDEDDNNVPPKSDVKKLKIANLQQKLPEKVEQQKSINKNATTTTENLKAGESRLSNLECDFLGTDPDSPTYRHHNDEKKLLISPTTAYARITGTDSHKLQLMKASFFDTAEEEMDQESVHDNLSVLPGKDLSNNFFNVGSKIDRHSVANIYTPILRSNFISSQTSLSTNEEQMIHETNIRSKSKLSNEITGAQTFVLAKPFPDPSIAPITKVMRCHSEVIPLSESILNKLHFRSAADFGIQMGRVFRSSWGMGLTLLSLSTQEQAAKIPLQNTFDQLGSYVCGRIPGDTTSMNVVQRLQILGGNGAEVEYIQMFKESIEGHLKIQLANCIMGQEGDCPTFNVATETASTTLSAHSKLAQELADQFSSDIMMVYTKTVFKLCVALWGDLPDINISTGNEKHHTVMVRKEAVGEWLQSVVKETVEQEIAEIDTDDKIILSLLTALRLEEACQIARKVGDHCLALLMAQLRSGLPVKEMVKQQLAVWQDLDVDENLSINRLKLFTLIAGEPLISSKHGTINTCEGLDWKRALAVHLWYLSSPTASITDVLDLYESSFNVDPTEAYSVIPEPEYRNNEYDPEANNKKSVHDLCFHILKLYCTGNHSLEKLLNPLTYTLDPFDYRLSWLMQQTLLSLGYSHLSEYVTSLTHINFATQLEGYGLWHWAIFVILHLRDAGRRRTAVLDLLARHVEIDDIPEYVKQEEFLKEELGIPSAWIHQAKAMKSRVSKRYGEAAWYFIQAEEWNMAHEIIIEHLAADAIINENYEYLQSLLNPLVPEECSNIISNWPNQGQLLWDYIEITTQIQNLLNSSDSCTINYKLELLKPRLTSLCSKIDQFPCLSAKHRLCQAEIAKRTLHVAKNLLILQANENNSMLKVLVYLISQLPLPEDYAQQELRPIINMCVNEAVSQKA